MSEKTTKKLKRLAALYYQAQPLEMPNRKPLQKIYQDLKTIHKNGRRNQNR